MRPKTIVLLWCQTGIPSWHCVNDDHLPHPACCDQRKHSPLDQTELESLSLCMWADVVATLPNRRKLSRVTLGFSSLPTPHPQHTRGGLIIEPAVFFCAVTRRITRAMNGRWIILPMVPI